MTAHRTVTIGDSSVKSIDINNTSRFTLIAGPCQIESREHALEMSQGLNEICERLKINFIYKSSFDKANRSSESSARGLGIDKGLAVLAEVRETLKIPVVTDIHSESQCQQVAEVVDLLQIPAFLCRQTDLLQAAAATGKPLHIKKGQFLAPWDMKNVVSKVESFGHNQILLCERGASFGYNTLVSDMRSLPIMAKTGYPVIFDATHSVQQPGGLGKTSGGQREFVSVLARAALAVGVAGIFLEVHNDPDNAPSDGPNMLYLKDLENLLKTLLALDKIIKTSQAA